MRKIERETSEPGKKRKKYIDDFLMEKANKEKLDIELVKLIAELNLPFRVLDSKVLRNFLKMLNPSYIPLTAKTLSSSVLQTVSDEYEDKVQKYIWADECLSIVVDECKEVDRSKVLNILLK